VDSVPEQEFSRLFERAGRSLLAQAYLLTGDRQESQDLVQEVFLRAWRGWKRVSVLENPDAWLRKVLYNLAVGRFRRLSVRRAHDALSSIRSSSAGPSVGHLDVVRAIRALPTKQRVALVLVAFQQLTVAEAAKEMRASEGTVRVWISRGRASIAVALGLDVAPLSRNGEADAAR
jgi:RNA polymerase sigma-70 factor (ECF subfamily)